MDTGDRRRRELRQFRGQRFSGLRIWQQALQCIERNSEQEIVELTLLPVGSHAYDGCFRLKRLNSSAKLDLSTKGADVIAGSAVEFGKRHGWDSHNSSRS